MSFLAIPLFDTYKEFFAADRNEPIGSAYPEITDFLDSLQADIPEIQEDFNQVRDFLWSKCRRSEATYNAFRSETERFLLWAWLVRKTSIALMKRRDIEQYIDFVYTPPESWIGIKITRRFSNKDGCRMVNDEWRPFVAKLPKSSYLLEADGVKPVPDRASYRLANKSLLEVYSNLNVLYNHLVESDYAYGNSILAARKNCPYRIIDDEAKLEHRLSELQWDYVLNSTREKADQDVSWELHLFIIASLKSLYLRVSELAVRDQWTPTMGDFYQEDGYWWFRAFGKGGKKRKVSVPDDFLEYLTRYRLSRSLPELPGFSEQSPLLKPVKRHNHGLKQRMIAVYAQEAFTNAYQRMIADGFTKDARALQAVSTHWLRHTGASMDVDHRPLLDLSADLGHATIATTDKEYVHADDKRRGDSGKKRMV